MYFVQEEFLEGDDTIKNFFKVNCAHLLLPLLLLLLSLYNERFWLNEAHGPDLSPLYLIRILLVLSGFFLSKKIYQLYLSSRGKPFAWHSCNKKQKYFLIIFLWLTIWYGFWLFIHYPGSYTSDTAETLRQITSMEINNWFSYLHPLLYLYLYQIYPHLLIVGIFQVGLFSLIFADMTSYLFTKIKMRKECLRVLLCVVFVLFFSSIASITAYTFFYSRDVVFSVLQLYLAFYCFKVFLESRDKILRKNQIFFMIALSMFLSLYRIDAISSMIVVLSCLLLFRKVSVAYFGKMTIIASLVFLLLNNVLPEVLKVQDFLKKDYKLTLVAYPLGFITSHEAGVYLSNDYKRDEEIINTITSIENLKNHTSCYGVNDFMWGDDRWDINATEVEFGQFYKNAYRIFIKNPHLFLAARTCNFVRAIGITTS